VGHDDREFATVARFWFNWQSWIPRITRSESFLFMKMSPLS